MICSHRQNHISLKKISLNLSISHPLSFSFSLFYPLPPVRVRIVATYFWFCGNLEFMYINSFLSQPSRESPTIGFAETKFQFPAGKNVGDLETFTIWGVVQLEYGAMSVNRFLSGRYL